jgi:hypothetical protein
LAIVATGSVSHTFLLLYARLSLMSLVRLRLHARRRQHRSSIRWRRKADHGLVRVGALGHELTAKECAVIHHQSLCLDACFNASALADLHGVMRRGTARQQTRHFDVRRLDVGLDDAPGFDHELARESKRSANAAGDFEFAFSANAAFNRDASFDSTRHGRGERNANPLRTHDLDDGAASFRTPSTAVRP